MPDVKTYDWWERLGGYGREGVALATVMRNYARQHGAAHCLYPNGDVVVVKRTSQGRLSRRTYKLGEVFSVA